VRAARYVDIVSARRRRSLARSLQGILRSLDPLMYDVAAIAIGLACFAVAFLVLYVLDRV